MTYFNIVSESEESTVVAEYHSQAVRSVAYQSEKELEKEFIHLLQEQGYEFLSVRSEEELLANLRKKLEELNDYIFSDTEWQQMLHSYIIGKNEGIAEKTQRIQNDHVCNLHCDNGSTKNIRLIDKKNIHNNQLQVMHQYVETGGAHKTRWC